MRVCHPGLPGDAVAYRAHGRQCYDMPRCPTYPSCGPQWVDCPPCDPRPPILGSPSMPNRIECWSFDPQNTRFILPNRAGLYTYSPKSELQQSREGMKDFPFTSAEMRELLALEKKAATVGLSELEKLRLKKLRKRLRKVVKKVGKVFVRAIPVAVGALTGGVVGAIAGGITALAASRAQKKAKVLAKKQARALSQAEQQTLIIQEAQPLIQTSARTISDTVGSAAVAMYRESQGAADVGPQAAAAALSPEAARIVQETVDRLVAQGVPPDQARAAGLRAAAQVGQRLESAAGPKVGLPWYAYAGMAVGGAGLVYLLLKKAAG